jgi:uncharacterized protein YdhG (YjbR/CyaY superfamily)
MAKAHEGSTQVESYISGFAGEVRDRLLQMREAIRAAAPQAEEKIGYGVPTYALHGNLVHFAGYDKHIGFYPGASGITQFAKELADYKHAQGSVQFPHNKPLPLELVGRIVSFRVKEQMRAR